MANAVSYRIDPAPSRLDWVMGFGLLMAAAGLVTLMAPAMSTSAFGSYAAWLLLPLGAMSVAIGTRRRGSGLAVGDVAQGAVSMTAGALLLANQLGNAAALAQILGLWAAARGVLTMALVIRNRDYPMRAMLLMGGAMELLFGCLLMISSPVEAVHIAAIVVGISLLLRGMAAVAVALSLRNRHMLY